jgi:hypothetical protein
MKAFTGVLLFAVVLFAQQPVARVTQCTDAGTTDAYVCSPSPALSAYAAGQRVMLNANTANTGAATVNISELGAVTIRRVNGGALTDLSDGDIPAGRYVELVYDGTYFQLLSGSGGGGMADPGSNGLVKRTALNTTAVATDGTDYVSPSGSATLTNKTFDAEATGNSLTIVDTVSGMFLRGNSSSQTWLVDYGSSGPTVGTSWNAGSDITYLSYASCYCTDADGPCWFSRSVRMPTDWDPSKAVDLSWAWGAGGTSGTIVFQVALACRGDGDARAVQYNTATEVLDTNSSSSVLNQVTATGLSTTGCSAGDTLTWRILRDRTHASDTFSGAFSIEGPWTLTFRRTQ